MLQRLAKHILFVFLGLACAGNALSQSTQSDSTSQSFINRNFSLTGDAGVYGELYGISGIAGRRPPSSARLYFRPTITVFNAFSMSFNFLLSTEGSSARQNINQLGVNPSWGWGNAHLGDFTDVLTPLTFDGIIVRGGGVNLNPGLFRFSAFGGYTQRAVSGGATNGSYSRYIYGGKIGVGKQAGSYFDISFLRARDKPSSLPAPKAAVAVVAPNGNDSWPVGNIENIRWASSGIFGYVKIELSRDGGATYEVLFDSVANTGLQQWIVSGPPTTQAIVRITSLQDSVSDVSDFPFTIGIGVADQQGNTPGSVVNSFAVTPEENLVGGADGRLDLFGNVLTVSGEIAGSAYTRDMNATPIDSLNIPSVVNGLFVPRTSSRADYAYNAQVGLNLPGFSAKIGYRRIGAGYVSLGVASLLPDQRALTFATTFRAARVGVNINASHQNDNLAQEKSYTTSRNQIGGNISVPFSQNWTASFMGNYLNMSNNASSDTFRIAYSTFMAGMTHTLFFGMGGILRTASVSYIYQTSADGNTMRQGSGMISHSANLSMAFAAASNISIMPAFSLNDSWIGNAGWTTTQTYSVSAQHRAFENRLATSLSFGYSKVQSANSVQIALSSSFGITKADIATLSAMQTFYNGSGSFSEHTISLNLSHRF